MKGLFSHAVTLLVLVTFGFSSIASANLQHCQRLLAPSDDELALSAIKELRHELEDAMGAYRDPFLFSHDVESSLAVWTTLMERFPLLKNVKEEAYEALKAGKPLPPKLEAKVLAAAKELLARKASADTEEFAGAVESLRKLELLRAKDIEPEQEPEKEKKPDDKKDEKEKKKGEKEKPPRKFPKFDDKYKVENLDTDNKQDSDSERDSLAIVNKDNIRYFRGVVYQHVDARRNTWSQVAVPPPMQTVPNPHPIYNVKMRIGPDEIGETFQLLVPQGFVPETFNHGHSAVWVNETGNYYFKSSTEQLQVPLLVQGVSTRPLTPVERDIYTAPSGAKLTEWPQRIQEQIHALQGARKQYFSGPQGDVKLAQVLAAYIMGNFKYAVDASPGASAMEMAHQGKFQCSNAATTLAALLRDEFQIPARPVGGFRGSGKRGEPDTSHVVHPGQGHAWVEVADEHGNWHGVDATPKEKDRETEQKKGPEDDYREFAEEGSDKDKKDSAEDSDAFDGTPKDLSEDAGKTLSEQIKEIAAEQKAKQEAASQKPGKQAGDEAKDTEGEKGSSKDKKSQAEADKKDRDGISELNKTSTDEFLKRLEENNPFIVRLLKRTAMWAIDPRLPSKTKVERLNTLKGIIGNDKENRFPAFKHMKGALAEAVTIFNESRPPIDKWIELVLQEAPKKALNHTVDELLKVQSHIEFTVKFMDPEERRHLLDLLHVLRALRQELGQIKHKEAKAIRIADELFKNLPGAISRKILRDKYALNDTLGDDHATLSLASDISAGKLNDFRAQAILGPHTNFLVDPIFKPSRGERRTWDPTVRRQRGRNDILMTGDPRNRKNFVRIYEHMSDEEALARGEMGYLTQRRRVKFPEGVTDTDPEKATIIALDTSGSMAGDNAYFQSMYVGALVDRALSDVNPNGKARHRVYIMAFDTVVNKVFEVTSREQALQFLKSVKNQTGNTGGGTDIQAALLEMASTLKRANETGDKALARANVILCSDGGSSVNNDVVKKAFDEVGSTTDIMMSFVAIGGTNPQLQSLVDTANLGAEKMSYLEFNGEDISHILQTARSKPEPISDFWTKYKWDETPSSVRQAFSALQRALGAYRALNNAESIGAKSGSEITAHIQKRIQVKTGKREEKRQGTVSGKLMYFRGALNHFGPGFSALERQRILESVLGILPETAGIPIDGFDFREIAELLHIFKWPATGVAGKLEEQK